MILDLFNKTATVGASFGLRVPEAEQQAPAVVPDKSIAGYYHAPKVVPGVGTKSNDKWFQGGAPVTRSKGQDLDIAEKYPGMPWNVDPKAYDKAQQPVSIYSDMEDLGKKITRAPGAVLDSIGDVASGLGNAAGGGAAAATSAAMRGSLEFKPVADAIAPKSWRSDRSDLDWLNRSNHTKPEDRIPLNTPKQDAELHEGNKRLTEQALTDSVDRVHAAGRDLNPFTLYAKFIKRLGGHEAEPSNVEQQQQKMYSRSDVTESTKSLGEMAQNTGEFAANVLPYQAAGVAGAGLNKAFLASLPKLVMDSYARGGKDYNKLPEGYSQALEANADRLLDRHQRLAALQGLDEAKGRAASEEATRKAYQEHVGKLSFRDIQGSPADFANPFRTDLEQQYSQNIAPHYTKLAPTEQESIKKFVASSMAELQSKGYDEDTAKFVVAKQLSNVFGKLNGNKELPAVAEQPLPAVPPRPVAPVAPQVDIHDVKVLRQLPEPQLKQLVVKYMQDPKVKASLVRMTGYKPETVLAYSKEFRAQFPGATSEDVAMLQKIVKEVLSAQGA